MKKKSELSPQPVKVKAIANVKNNNLFIPPPPFTLRNEQISFQIGSPVEILYKLLESLNKLKSLVGLKHFFEARIWYER
jgi:hypothetical protein